MIHRQHGGDGKHVRVHLPWPDHGHVLDAGQDAREARRASRDDLDPTDPGERPYRDKGITHDPCFLRDGLVVRTDVHENIAEHRVGRPRVRTRVRVACEPIEAHLCWLVDLVLTAVRQEQLPRDIFDVFRAVWKLHCQEP